jgi:hypothetical protein
MSQILTGVQFALATAFAAAKTITDITNASPGVASSATHGYLADDVLWLTNNWSRLNKRVTEVLAAPTADTFSLKEIDTSSTVLYPADGGAGTARKVSTWAVINQVMNVNPSGGEPRFVTGRYLETDVDLSAPDGFSPQQWTLDLDIDSKGLAGYLALQAQSESRVETVLRITTSANFRTYFPCFVAFNESPIMAEGQFTRVRAVISATQRATLIKPA